MNHVWLRTWSIAEEDLCEKAMVFYKNTYWLSKQNSFDDPYWNHKDETPIWVFLGHNNTQDNFLRIPAKKSIFM